MITEEAANLAAPRQNLIALQKAERIRLGRAALRHEVGCLDWAEGFERVAALLQDPPETIQSMAIMDLMQWVRRVGRSHARSILVHGDPTSGPIYENRLVRKLSERQRRALAEHIGETYVFTARG